MSKTPRTDDKTYAPNSGSFAFVDASFARELESELVEAKELNVKLVEALRGAEMFIENGVELGFIFMPDKNTPDPAHKTLPKIRAALKAGKEGE